MKLPPLPELPFLPETQEQRNALAWWAMEYGRAVQEECASVADRIGSDIGPRWNTHLSIGARRIAAAIRSKEQE
jgi:hypothetical protein